MPIITIEAGKMEKSQKETLIQDFTKVASKTLGIPEEAFVVLIKENDPDNVGSGGVMLSKKFAEQK
ncbi:MAG: tautomerase family protein [Thermoanaerobacteraceae bacterium]|nr:tautomerase family protein [Thermoanaerobacteraceae bacterium]